MLFQIALGVLALLVALNLGWLLNLRAARSAPLASAGTSAAEGATPELESPRAPAEQPDAAHIELEPEAPVDQLVEQLDTAPTQIAALELAPPQAIAPARGWATQLQTGGVWLRARWQEALAVASIGLIVLYIMVLFPRPAAITHPGQFGHPFQGFHWERDFMLMHKEAMAPTLAALVALACLGLFGLSFAGRRAKIQHGRAVPASLLLAGLGLAGIGQLALLQFFDGSALLFYGAALLLFVVWGLSYRPFVAADIFEAAWPRWLELTLLALTIGLTIFMRFYSLHSVPYGIEGDESKWTVEVIDVMVDGVFSNDGEFHISTMPASFFMQAPFHWLLGPSIVSARIAVASWSVLASLVFYVLARCLTSAPVAWLATTLLAVSLLDVSASRFGNVESHVKLAPLLALALLLWAVRSGKLIAYALAGLAVALGIVTYDTVLPLALVSGLLLLYELVRARADWATSLRRISVFGAPILVIAPMMLAYFSGRLSYYGDHAAGAGDSSFGQLGVLAQNVGDVLSALFVQNIGDFIYGREGPLFNSMLLPWLALGVVLALLAWRQRRILWILLWGGVFFFVAPVLTHTPVGRVFYPGLPAAYLLMALGLYAAYRDLGRALGPMLGPVLKPLALVFLALLALSNLYIYFNLMNDPLDRQSRRELYDITQQAAGPATLLLYPYVPASAEPIDFEQLYVIPLGTRIAATAPVEHYPSRVVPLDTLLASLRSAQGSYERAEVIWWLQFDDPTRAQREATLNALMACYPAATRIAGVYYDRYVIPGAALRAPACEG